MPGFLFDITEDGDALPAEELIELADENAAKNQAAKAIGELMVEALPNGDSKKLRIAVKAADGALVVAMRLEFATEWPARARSDAAP